MKTREIAVQITRIMPVVAREILLEFFQNNDIPQTQLFAIMFLEEQDGCRLSTISHELNVAAPTVTGIIDRLEQARYVVRKVDPDDRRAVNIFITQKGRKIVRQFRDVSERRWQEILNKLNVKEQAEYLRLLLKIRSHLS